MATNQTDVRVRLSAEGMAEVVGAFQKVGAAGKQSAKETSDAFSELRTVFSDVGRDLLGGLSLVYAIDKLKEMAKATLEGADKLNSLSKQTSLTTATIQGFQRAAHESSLSAEDANTALARFSVTMGKAELGSKNTSVALGLLGINTKQLTGLNADQKLALVSQKLAEVGDSAKRNAIEVALFGRAGADLDETLTKVGEEGVAGFIKRLKELGLFLDGDAIAALNRTKAQLRDLEDETRGMGQQLLVGLLPAVGAVADALTKSTTAGEGFRVVGALIGAVFKGVALVIIAVGGLIGANWAIIMNHITSAAQVAALAVRGHFIKAGEETIAAFKRDATILKEWRDQTAAAGAGMFANLPGAVTPTTAKTNTPTGPSAADIAAGRARYELLVAQLDNELQAIKINNQKKETEDKAAYEKGTLSIQAYYDKRAARIAAEYDEEIALARRKLAAQLAIPGAANDEAAQLQNAAKAEKLRGDIKQLNAQKELALTQDRAALEKQLDANAQAQIRAQITLLDLAGKRTEAARLRLQLEVDAQSKGLRAGGVGAPEVAGAAATATAQGEAKIGFDEATVKGKADLLSLDTQRKAIQDKINTGQVFSLQGEQQILALDRQRLPVLQAEAQAQIKLANETGSKEQIAAAEAFKEKVDQIAAATDTVGQQMKALKDGIQSSIGDGLNTFLEDAILNAKSLGQAFDNATKQIIADLLKMAIQIEEQKFLKALFGGNLFGGSKTGGSGVAGVVSTASSGVTTFFGSAAGGYVRGPGSGTSDSIPSLLSDKEFVVNAASTQRPGVLGFLQMLNAGAGSPRLRVPQLAGGGSIAAGLGSTAFVGAATRGAAPVQLHVAPEALHMTLRDWFEREVADANAKR